MSAFANTPGGGTIVFGLDENAGFAAVGGLVMLIGSPGQRDSHYERRT